MELYSGQGRVNLNKRDASGKVDPRARFFVGNAPHFSVNFKTGEVNLSVDEFKDEVLEIICGSSLQQSHEVIPADHHVDGDVEADISEFDIGDGAPFEYELTFEGVNTASVNNAGRMPRWQVRLHRVTFTPSEGWDLIGEDITSVKISGMAHKDELKDGKRGTVRRIHRESASGLRVQNASLEAVEA